MAYNKLQATFTVPWFYRFYITFIMVAIR